MTTKVLFLDVDGPMIPTRAWRLPGNVSKIHKQFDPCAVANILYVLETTGAKIVLSSTWGRVYDWADILHWFNESGIAPRAFHADAITPRFAEHTDRVIEIKAWLARHPEITHYAVLDDDTVDLPNFVKVSVRNGLMYEHVEELLTLLGSPCP